MKSVYLAIAASALLASPALAQSGDTHTTTINAHVAPKCAIDSSVTVINLNNGDDLSDAEGRVSAFQHTGSFGNVWCNGSSNSLSVTFSPLINAANTPLDASFTNRIDYTVESAHPLLSLLPDGSSVGGGTPISIPSGLPAFETGAGAMSNFTLTLVPTAANRRQVAGAYSGQIVVTVTAGI